MWSPNIREFVEEHQLNPDEDQWNFRHIFGTNTKKDHHYNTPRVWFAQRYLNPVAAANQGPEDPDMPFIRKPERKISVEDIQYLLASHYNETVYDPLGSGTAEQRKVYRAISLSRTAQSHILQMRTNVDEKHAAVQWVEFGVPSFCPWVPFFTNADDTDASYRELPAHMDWKNAFWMYEALATIVESHYNEFIEPAEDYKKALNSWARRHLAEVDQRAAGLDGKQLTTYLTAQNHLIAKHYQLETRKLIMQLLTDGAALSQLTFKMDPNL